jgi:predicted phosphodiesterase
LEGVPLLRIVIVSDIHGNIVGMKAVLQKLYTLGGAYKLVVAGDVLTASSGNTDLVQLLKAQQADIIRGNAETFLDDPNDNIDNVPLKFRQYMTDWYDWLKKRLSTDEWDFLMKSPFMQRYQFDNGKSMFVCHSSPKSVWDRYCGPKVPIKILNMVYGGNEEDVIVYGHYHNNHVIHLNDKILVNAASVGLRKDGESHFTIIEDDDEQIAVKQFSTPYNVEEEQYLNQICKVPELNEQTSSSIS